MQLSQRQTNWIASAASQIWTLQQTIIIHIINADKMQLQLPQSKIMEDHLVVHIVDYIDRMSSICTPRNENCARGPTAAQGLSTPILHLASNGHSSTMDLKLNNDNWLQMKPAEISPVIDIQNFEMHEWFHLRQVAAFLSCSMDMSSSPDHSGWTLLCLGWRHPRPRPFQLFCCRPRPLPRPLLPPLLPPLPRPLLPPLLSPFLPSLLPPLLPPSSPDPRGRLSASRWRRPGWHQRLMAAVSMSLTG